MYSRQNLVVALSVRKKIVENSIETISYQNCEIPATTGELEPGLITDSETFVPFILIDGHCRALVMFDHHMDLKRHIFLERSSEGWTGNGDDWTSLAEIVVAECLCALTEPVTFDSDADLFSARGCRTTLEKLGVELQAIYRNDDAIRDLMSRIIVARNVKPMKFDPLESTQMSGYQSRRTTWM
jgi:Immunity protein 51